MCRGVAGGGCRPTTLRQHNYSAWTGACIQTSSDTNDEIFLSTLMSYQVLARKWRPDSFENLQGQSHVVQALRNALDQKRLHHAYLFTGTSGVGKTTLGRILAKCLNCEEGLSSSPCNACRSCQDITSGCFIDLIEVDAASRTKVEDTRELLENVPYAPTTGRFKVYLIDEVHMLSTHSFNALLKTLEEPPPHVKFFLATTDPQKIPVTVLSRCLQFRLKSLTPELISNYLAHILQQESIDYENEALIRLAHAAEGNMRDALSLLDQAIAFSNNNISAAAIKSMLRTIEANHLYEILEALREQKPKMLLQITEHLIEQSLDLSKVVEELISLLHQIAITQFVDEASANTWDKNKVNYFAQQFTPPDIQLLYQIALIGRKDFPLAPTHRIGLEMILLRMLAFQPISNQPLVQKKQISLETITPKPPQDKVHSTLSHGTPREHADLSKPTLTVKPQTETITTNNNQNCWQQIISELNLSGMCAVIASHCILEEVSENEITLALDPHRSILLSKKQEERLAIALQQYYKRPIRLKIKIGRPEMETPASKELQANENRQTTVKESISKDPNLQKMIETFNARILPDTIEANDNNR